MHVPSLSVPYYLVQWFQHLGEGDAIVTHFTKEKTVAYRSVLPNIRADSDLEPKSDCKVFSLTASQLPEHKVAKAMRSFL